MDSSSAAFWRRAPQDRADEAATFFIAPARQAFLRAAREYVETIAAYDGLTVGEEEALVNLLAHISDWQGDHVRREVLQID